MTTDMVLIPLPQLTSLIEDSIRNILKEGSLNNDVLLSSEDVRDIFKISDPTLCKWRKLGKIPFTRIDNKIFYRKTEIMEVMKWNK